MRNKSGFCLRRWKNPVSSNKFITEKGGDTPSVKVVFFQKKKVRGFQTRYKRFFFNLVLFSILKISQILVFYTKFSVGFLFFFDLI